MNLEYTYETLATSTGATAAVLLITQYMKGYLPKWFPTRLFVLALSAVVLTGTWAAIGVKDWKELPLVLLNAFPVAFAAMGAYDTTLKKVEIPTVPETPAE